MEKPLKTVFKGAKKKQDISHRFPPPKKKAYEATETEAELCGEEKQKDVLRQFHRKSMTIDLKTWSN